MERAARRRRRDPELHGVAAGARDVHRVLEPFAGIDPADVVAAARRRLEIDVGRAERAAAVADRGVVVRDPLAAVVEVFRFHRAGNRRRRARVR